MQIKHTSSGLTLLEIMFSLIIASMILLYLIPQQLKTSPDQMVSQTVAEMNQIVLAARNYYQDSLDASPATPAPVLATLWPQTLSALSNNNYLPPATASLCSPWPSSTYDATCGYHVPYIIFPNASTLPTPPAYDTNAVGILASGSNKGGNFWGVSITLPNATIAQAVEQRLPFATLCAPAQLKGGTSTSCTATSNTVTTIVPRPAQWSASSINYSNDGLIQKLNAFKLCADDAVGDGATNLAGQVQACINPSYSKMVTYYIPMPTTCSAGTKPAIFVYPSILETHKDTDTPNDKPNNTVAATSATAGFGYYYPGISVRTLPDPSNPTRWILWMRAVTDTRKAAIGPRKFHKIRVNYFTTCSPNNDANKWDPSNFPGKNIDTVNSELEWTPIQ